jgi:PTS system nitrogen regulatory IIA component
MKITDFLSPTDATVEQKALGKDQLLKELARRAAARLGLSSGKIADTIFKREKLGSTGMGGGVAIPHARIPDLTKPFGLLARLRKPIEFEAVDGRPVDIVFLLLAPTAPESEQLNALACVARKLRSTEVVADLRQANDGAEVFAAITAERDEAATGGLGTSSP